MNDTAFRVLMVCTGNVCRSPQAESLLAARTASLSSSVTLVSVSSAGTHALVGEPMTEQALARTIDLGAFPRVHTSRQLTPEMVSNADLVLGMAREHRRSIALVTPSASRRTFTLIEFARILTGCANDAAAGKVHRPAFGDWNEWLALAESRRGYYPALAGELDDVVDPYRRSNRTYVASAEQVDEAIDSILGAVFAK